MDLAIRNVVNMFPSASVSDHSDNKREPCYHTELKGSGLGTRYAIQSSGKPTAAGMITMSSQPQCKSFLKNRNCNLVPVIRTTKAMATLRAAMTPGPLLG